MNKLLFILFFVLLGCQPRKEPQTYRNYIASWSPDGQQLLFYSDRNGNWDVFLIQADGNGLRQITQSTANETEPYWHPKTNTFVYATDASGERRIHEYDFETGKTRAITIDQGKHSSPVWSPQGTHIAFLIQEGETWKVVAKATSDSTLQVLYNGTIYPGRPTWSPAGEGVMYSVAVDSVETLHLAGLDGQISSTFVTGFNSMGNAVISPDGKYIAFDAHSEDILDSGDGKWEIYTMNIETKEITRLTQNDRDDWGPRWSADGTRISFLGDGFDNTGYELFVLDINESGMLQLTDKRK
jgi:Tol biopolymer transport system component